MNSNPNMNPNSPNSNLGGSPATLGNSTGVTGYRSAAEYLAQSAEEEKQERAKREKRMRIIEHYGDPLAPIEQSFGQSYSKSRYNGR